MLFRIYSVCALITLHMFSVVAYGAEQFVRDYTYHASDTDSKVSARQAALQQLQVQVIQEAGVNVQANFSQTETLENNKFSKNAQSNILTSAKSHLKTQVLEEKWDGKIFYIKVKIELDKSAFEKSLSANGEGCKNVSDQVKKLLPDYNNPEVQAKLIALSKQHGFDGQCNAWQYLLMNTFREKNITTDDYRTYLLESVKTAPDHVKGKLLYAVIPYITNFKVISKEEFTYVTDAIQVMNHTDIRWIIEALIDATAKSLPYGTSEELKKRNESKQWASMLDWQISWFYKLANEGKLGKPNSMSLSQILLVAMERIAIKKPLSFYSTYMQYHSYLEDAENIKLHKKLMRYFKRNMAGGVAEILDIYIKDVPDNLKVNTAIFKMLIHIEKESEKTPYFQTALNGLIENNSKRIAYIINGAKYKQATREDWLNRYDLIKEFQK